MEMTYNPCDECPRGIDRRNGSGNNYTCRICEFAKLRAIGHVKEMSALVKARDEGRAVVLPCKVGDVLYTASPVKGMVTSFEAPDLSWIIENIPQFGKTVFITRAEAEAALQKGGHHEAYPV